MILLQLAFFPLPTYVFWLVVGFGLLGISYFLPGPSIAATGFASIITGLITLLLAPYFGLQIIIWAILSVGLSFVLRDAFSPRKTPQVLQPAREGRVVKEIPAKGVGRVAYEGTRWRARSQDKDLAIASDQIVRVVGRQRNTLIVAPVEADEAIEQVN